MSKTTVDVLCEIAAERERQDAKWGEQNHPDGTGCYTVRSGPEALRDDTIGYVRSCRAEDAKASVEEAVRDRRLTYRHILGEEWREAQAEHDPARLRAELVQVAAVAVAWVEKIDRHARIATIPTPPESP